MYGKLYVSRYEMIKATNMSTGPEDFRKLQKAGVENKSAPSPPGGPGGPGGLPGGLRGLPGGLNIPR